MDSEAVANPPLSRRLGQGPVVLLVGQRYLESHDGFDPFVTAIAKHLGSEQADYGILLSAEQSDKRSLQLWMAQLCEHVQAPPWLSSVLSTPWNAVYTSAVDTVLRAKLRSEWRDVQPVLNEKYRPANPRNPVSLACTYLYGAVGEADDLDAAPLGQVDLLRRRPIASALLQRVIEDLTPLGTLLIIGYDPATDWLRPSDLAGMLAHLSPGQAHVFEHAHSIATDSDLGQLVAAGILVTHAGSLADSLGLIPGPQLGVAAAYAESPRSVFINNEPYHVPTTVWNAAGRSALPLTLSDVSEPPALSEDARYEAFRRFLSSADGVPHWDGFKRGFAFRRLFEDKLQAAVMATITDRNLTDKPIVLHGAAGTGKTTAAARLALQVAQQKKCPVLFISNRSQRMAWTDIDPFLQWAADRGAPSALVVWDGMVAEPDQYFALSQRLAARGRQVCVVGTTYETDSPLSEAVLADPVLFDAERAGVAAWLEEMAAGAGQQIPAIVGGDRYWLALLYRALPPSRQPLRRSVLRDVEQTEVRIRELGPEAEEQVLTPIQQAMIDAGLIRAEQVDNAIPDTSTDSGVFERLTNYTMVPGRFGLFPPVDLVLRTTGIVPETALRRALNANSVIVWHEDQAGNITLGPRNTVEAEIIVQSRMGTAAAEVAVARELLANIRDDSSPYGDGPEVRFATELARAFGAGSSERHRFANHWLAVADCLEALRTERSFQAPYLMVQEANLRREWANRVWAAEPERAEDQARKALDVAEAALALIPEDSRNTRLRSMLLVEQASSVGGVLTHATGSFGPQSQNGRLLQGTLDAIQDARHIDPGSYYPLDVLFWITRNLLNARLLRGADAANALASTSNAFLTADPDMFPPSQQEQLWGREIELAQLLSDADLAAEAWEALIEMGSGAGHYIEALRHAGLRPGVRLGEIARQDAAAGYSYLRDHWDLAQRDARNLELALDLWWLSRCGRRLLDGERIPLPFSDADWSECLTLALRIEEQGISQRDAVIRYIRGIAEFHLGKYGASFATFDELDGLSEGATGRKRIIRTYRASTPNGTPQSFTGTVESVDGDGRAGRVFVPTVGRSLHFFPREFGWPGLRRGDTLGEFYVAFNLRGISADSPRRDAVANSRALPDA